MDKYTKVEKPKEPTPADHVRISATGHANLYITYAFGLLQGKPAEGDTPATDPVDKIVIQATGNALPKAVQVAEIVKRRIKGLHQTSHLGSTEIVDEFEPKEEGLEKVTKSKMISVMEITLSKKPLDTKHFGYQPPLADDEVTEMTPEEMAERAAKKRTGPKPKKKAKGKGKGKGKDAKGKGKGKGKGEKGKGKGEAAEKPKEEPKTRGRGRGGKGAGKGEAKEATPAPTRGRGRGRGKGGK